MHTKGDFSLPLKLSVLNDLKARELLRAPLTLRNAFSLHALEEHYLSLNEHLTAANLRLRKSKRSSNTSLTLIREGLRPGCVRWKIWLYAVVS
jgi:hypothetical protein